MRNLSSRKFEDITPYLFISPFILAFIIFFAFPSVYSFVLSFYKYKGYGTASFVGLENYHKILTYGMFWTAVKNTLFYYIVHLAPVMILSFLISLAMHSKYVKYGNIYKPIIFLSQIMPIVAGTLVFKILLSTRYGPINALFGTQIPFLEDPTLMKNSVVVVEIWRGLGCFVVVFLAGLTTISHELIEASKIDGASSFKNLIYITIPLMRPIFLFAFVMDSITSFRIYIEPNILLSGSGAGAPPDGMPMVNILTQNITGGAFGMASAVGWILFVLTLLMYLLQSNIFRERENL